MLPIPPLPSDPRDKLPAKPEPEEFDWERLDDDDWSLVEEAREPADLDPGYVAEPGTLIEDAESAAGS
jgi:hypothetical protein